MNFKNKLFFLFLLLTSFIEGGVVMAVEILGAKMIAPFFGTSLYVWSATLAITLFGLTLGYFLGGMFSTKKNIARIYHILSIAALLVGAMNFLSFWILSECINLDIKVGTIVSLCIYLLPPLCFLGMTSPLIINELSDDFKNPGKSAGIVYAISTIGGILMTFIVGFILIPTIGVGKTCLYYAFGLSILPLLYFLLNKNLKGIIISLISIVIIILFNINTLNIKHNLQPNNSFNIKYKSEGLLGILSVVDINQYYRMLSINNASQTFMHIPTKKAIWEYVYRIATYSSIKPEKSNILVCGLGGGVLVNELIDLNFNVDVCEIDSRMEFVAKKYFYLNDNCNIYIDDARHFIKKNKKKYDVIILDLSIAETVPSNVYTIESFKEIKKALNKDGFFFLHYLNHKNGEGRFAVKAIGNTLIKAGFNTQLLNTTHNLKTSNEIVYFSSLNKINLETYTYNRLPKQPEFIKTIPKNKDVYDYYSFSDGQILTDDKPNMDILHQYAALQSRRGTIKKLNKEAIKNTEVLYH